MSKDLEQLLTGQAEEHLVPCWSGVRVHREVLAPLQRLRERAAAAGFELAVASGFRSFDRQQQIWQDKVAGRRPLHDTDGRSLALASLSREQLLWVILRWSALPGTSRHHWGTDLDVYDAAALPPGERLQLVPQEYAAGGPFEAFAGWLQARIDRDESEGFYRPYDRDRGAVAPEPWHISYRPLASKLQRAFDENCFRQLLDSGCWPLTEEIAAHADSIYRRYVQLESPGAG